MMQWDPAIYRRYGDERARPFLDLLARVRAAAPRRVVDLGCGSGEQTTLLAQRWPQAVVEGIDSSPEMIAAARRLEGPVAFTLGDVAEWTPPADADVVVSNSLLQWVPTHRELLRSWAAADPTDGWLAFQVPGNFDAPSHRQLRELAGTWGLDVLRHHDAVDPPERYAALLLDAGLVADVWETTYLHLLSGPDPVLDWLRGTGLRPVLAALSPADGERFCAELAPRLRAVYPPGPHGTLLPFRRIFAVGHRG
jgi:trans-aconitate 2-methyltransferase